MTEINIQEESYSGPANLSPIPLSIGSPAIRPEDKNKIKANAVEAMNHYADQEILLLKRQADLIMTQVREIESRLKISEQMRDLSKILIEKNSKLPIWISVERQ